MRLLSAAARVDITPERALPLAGFVGRDAPFVGVAQRLEANACAIRFGDRCAVILTLDTLFPGPVLAAEVAKHFVEVHGQRENDLLLLGSHTHFAPSLDSTKPALGGVDEAYCERVISRCKSLIDAVLATPGDAIRLERRRSNSQSGINRRRPWPLPRLVNRRPVLPESAMAPNPAGPYDPTVTVWQMSLPNGQVQALLWHFACHPTGYPSDLEISADFVGVVRERLRARIGAEIPVLFMQGFAGDIRPRVPETRPFLRRAVRSLVFGPNFDSFSTPGWSRWAEGLADDVEGALLATSSQRDVSDDGRIATASWSVPLSSLVVGERSDRAVRFRRMKIGPLIDVVAVAAEPLTGLRALVPFDGAVAVGYMEDVFGYWPSDGEQRRGGYEVHYFLKPFSLAGQLRPQLDHIFADAMAALSNPS